MIRKLAKIASYQIFRKLFLGNDNEARENGPFPKRARASPNAVVNKGKVDNVIALFRER